MTRKRNLFEKLGLIVPEGNDAASVSSPDDLDARLAELSSAVASTPSTAPSVPTAPAFTADDDLVLPEGVDLATIYAEASVPAAAFPIEKLAKLVEGLNQLDAATKRTAVSAMDAADDSWNIDDVLSDGRKKIGALQNYLSEINACEQAINDEVNKRINDNQASKAKSLEDIDAKIAALQAEREKAISDAASESSNLRAQGAAAAEAAERERTRINTAIKGQEGLVSLFGATVAPSSTPSNK